MRQIIPRGYLRRTAPGERPNVSSGNAPPGTEKCRHQLQLCCATNTDKCDTSNSNEAMPTSVTAVPDTRYLLRAKTDSLQQVKTNKKHTSEKRRPHLFNFDAETRGEKKQKQD